ncbi:hypothetical protein ALC57_07052, partial [Trachymyrmex cornetzi]
QGRNKSPSANSGCHYTRSSGVAAASCVDPDAAFHRERMACHVHIITKSGHRFIGVRPLAVPTDRSVVVALCARGLNVTLKRETRSPVERKKCGPYPVTIIPKLIGVRPDDGEKWAAIFFKGSPTNVNLLRSLFSDVIPATVLAWIPRRILECQTQKLTAEDKQLVDACSSSVTEVCTSKLRDVAYVHAALLYTADSRNDYPSNLSRTYLPRPALGPRSLKLTEVVPSLKLAPRSTEAVRSCTMQGSAFFTHKTTLSQEHSGARTPPVRYPFTRSSTNANAGFRSSALIKCFNMAWIFMRLYEHIQVTRAAHAFCEIFIINGNECFAIDRWIRCFVVCCGFIHQSSDIHFSSCPTSAMEGLPKYIVLPHVAVHTNVLSHSSTMQGRDTIPGTPHVSPPAVGSVGAVYERRLPRLVNSQGKIARPLRESPGTSFAKRETAPGSGVSQDEKNSCMMKIG